MNEGGPSPFDMTTPENRGDALVPLQAEGEDISSEEQSPQSDGEGQANRVETTAIPESRKEKLKRIWTKARKGFKKHFNTDPTNPEDLALLFKDTELEKFPIFRDFTLERLSKMEVIQKYAKFYSRKKNSLYRHSSRVKFDADLEGIGVDPISEGETTAKPTKGYTPELLGKIKGKHVSVNEDALSLIQKITRDRYLGKPGLIESAYRKVTSPLGQRVAATAVFGGFLGYEHAGAALTLVPIGANIAMGGYELLAEKFGWIKETAAEKKTGVLAPPAHEAFNEDFRREQYRLMQDDLAECKKLLGDGIFTPSEYQLHAANAARAYQNILHETEGLAKKGGKSKPLLRQFYDKETGVLATTLVGTRILEGLVGQDPATMAAHTSAMLWGLAFLAGKHYAPHLKEKFLEWSEGKSTVKDSLIFSAGTAAASLLYGLHHQQAPMSVELAQHALVSGIFALAAASPAVSKTVEEARTRLSKLLPGLKPGGATQVQDATHRIITETGLLKKEDGNTSGTAQGRLYENKERKKPAERAITVDLPDSLNGLITEIEAKVTTDYQVEITINSIGEGKLVIENEASGKVAAKKETRKIKKEDITNHTFKSDAKATIEMAGKNIVFYVRRYGEGLTFNEPLAGINPSHQPAPPSMESSPEVGGSEEDFRMLREAIESVHIDPTLEAYLHPIDVRSLIVVEPITITWKDKDGKMHRSKLAAEEVFQIKGGSCTFTIYDAGSNNVVGIGTFEENPEKLTILQP